MKTYDELHTDRTHAAYAIVGHAEMILKVHDWKMAITELEWDGLRKAIRRYDEADKAMEATWTVPATCEALIVQNPEDTMGRLCGKKCAPGQNLCSEHQAEGL